jgi:signal transduction histidine kinase
MTIRSRMSLWYLATTVVLLLIFSLTTYYSARHLAFRALDREHDVIAASVEGGFDPGTGSFGDLQNTVHHVNRNLKESYIAVYDADERPVYQSPLTEKISLPITLVRDKDKAREILSQPSEQMRSFMTTDDQDVKLLAVSRKLYRNGETIGWIVIATPIGDIQESARILLISMLAGVFLTGVLAGGWSYYLTRRNLRPIADIAQTARRISSSNLADRMDVENRSDEIGQLANVLDDLLERLQKAFEIQRRFVADGAHELKTPLAVLRTHWEDELNNPDVPADVKEKLVGDIESISRLTRVINNLLFLSRTEFAESGFDVTEIRLDDLLAEVVEDTSVLATMKSQELTLSATAGTVIQGDRDRLYQLFFNLIDNAIKYTPEGGKISVESKMENSDAIVRFSDTGPGIPDAALPHVFERFYRVGADRSVETGGSGLGLSIARMIAESHGGSLDVTSRTGEGSTFTVRIPPQ